ncbi:MAG: hypothetical protein GX629_04640 [Phycisphaerae bacterium]|jgi:hypothetical protein|nr:hypothetical protein [Phycisphaerae bacterium]
MTSERSIKNIEETALSELIETVVVVDTESTTIFIGTLVRVARDCLVLEDADVHDCEQGYSGKELYVVNARMHGFTPNREKVYIPMHKIIAISVLDDIIVE